jgi:hypothetical protein
MSVRKRSWCTASEVKAKAQTLAKAAGRPESEWEDYESAARASMTPTREAWIVDYVDQEGDRHIETFARKKDADDYHATVKVDIRKGVHSAERNGCRGCGKLDQAG